MGVELPFSRRNQRAPACILALTLFALLTLSTVEASVKLDSNEVKALKEIGKKLGKKDWDYSVNPCSGKGSWNVTNGRKEFDSSVTCVCSGNQTCHVIRLALKSQNLSGVLPPEISKLKHLRTLDISRNLLTGSIPSQWATMQLVELSVMGNRLSGYFRKFLPKFYLSET